MFFLISKITGLLLSPLLWIFILLMLGLFVKNARLSRRLLWTSLIFTFLFSNTFLASECVRHWESPILPPSSLTGSYAAGIVLGGGMVQTDRASGRLFFRDNTDRIIQAVELYKSGRIEKIILSGGSGQLINKDMPEAPLLRKHLLAIGIPDSVILVDSNSVNTYQNAVNTKDILANHVPTGRYLLITSALHMPRAAACFKKQNMAVTLYPTNPVAGPRHFDLQHLVVPQAKALQTFTDFFHEAIGFAAYKLMGYL